MKQYKIQKDPVTLSNSLLTPSIWSNEDRIEKEN